MAEWKYRQMTSFLKKIKPLRSINTLTAFERKCAQTSEDGHTLSWTYRMILGEQEKKPPYFMKEWERELGQVWTDKQINKMISLTFTTSISTKVQEMAYKFLARWYRTPVKMAQISSEANDKCWRGCGQRGTFLHLWWTCPIIKRFWELVAPWIKKMMTEHIEFGPIQYLFHGMTGPIKKYRESITPHLLNAAKKLIPKYWRQDRIPSVIEWRNEVNIIKEAERWVHVVKNQRKKFETTWANWEQCAEEIIEEGNTDG